MGIPANIAVAWPSTVASIPGGWTRETGLDAHYIRGADSGADTDLSTDRGNLTHTHTSPAHTPLQNSHTHTFAAPGADESTIVAGTTSGSAASDLHGHNTATSASATAVNNSVTITVDTASNDLPFTEVIWIKSDGTPTVLPVGCYAFFVSDTLPSGWSRVQADTYLKGAGTGNDGGATGGAATHTHTSPAHTHTQAGHSHNAANSSGPNLIESNRGTGTDTVSTISHVHPVGLDTTVATNQSVTTTINAANHEPPYTKLNTIQAGSATLPSGIVCLWLGTNANIPANWTRLTLLDGSWLKGAAADGESGVVTGGSSQHSHTASDCQPIQNAHTHIALDGGAVGSVAAAIGSAGTFPVPGHTHSWNISNDAATNNAVSVTIDLCAVGAAFPQHRTVIFVSFTPTVTPSGVLTTYDTGIFETGVNRENIGPKLTPWEESAIWAGRVYPGLPGEPVR